MKTAASRAPVSVFGAVSLYLNMNSFLCASAALTRRFCDWPRCRWVCGCSPSPAGLVTALAAASGRSWTSPTCTVSGKCFLRCVPFRSCALLHVTPLSYVPYDKMFLHCVNITFCEQGYFFQRLTFCILIIIPCLLQAHSHCDVGGLWQHPDSLPGRQLWDTVLAAWTEVLALCWMASWITSHRPERHNQNT